MKFTSPEFEPMKIRSSLFIAFIFASLSVLAQNSIQQAVDQFAASESMKHASIGFYAIDLETGKVVAEYDPNRTMPTASTAKLFATATAIEILGPSYQPITRVYSKGTIDTSGNLSGDLWIRGGGDPTLGSKYFTKKETRAAFLESWANDLAKAGIKRISGDIIVDASEFGYEGAPDGWNWVDMGNYYGAGPSGLTIFDNLIEYDFRTGSAGTKSKIKSISPEVPSLSLQNYVMSSTRGGDNAYIYGAPYSFDRFATGTLPQNRSSFVVKGSLPDPELQFGYELEKILTAKGIAIGGDINTGRSLGLTGKSAPYAEMNLLITHKGKSIQSIANKTNERSINLFAEHLMCLSGHKKYGNGSTKSGIRAANSLWATKFDINGMQLNDGSGLSRTNAISAKHFVGLLKAMYGSKNKEVFMNSLPVAGKSGTMRNICKGQAADGRMMAKSGSMTRIRSYAGYVKSSSGKTYAYAFIVNNHTCSTGTLLKKMGTVFNRMAVR